MIDRRGLGLSLGASALLGCASPLAKPAIQVNAAETPPPDEPDAARLATGADASQRVTVPVRINGQGPFAFVVDTGANRTVIAADLAARLDLPEGAPAQVHGVAGAEPTPTAIIGRFEADSIQVRDILAPALPRDRLGADGLLGVDVLRDRRVLINFVDHSLTISADHNTTSDVTGFDLRQRQTDLSRNLGQRIAVPARYRFGQLIIIGADVSGRRVTAFVDSGSQSTVGNNNLRHLAQQGSPSDPKALRLMSPILSATGQVAQGELGRIPLLRIGGLEITGLTTVFADLHVFAIWDLLNRPSLLLGMDILGRFNAIELNYAKREVAFYVASKHR